MKTAPHVIVLYGSCARGNNDALSDRDILIVGRPPSSFIPYKSGKQTSIVTYSWLEFEAMHTYGSLFLRHLRSESVVIMANDEGRQQFDTLLRGLPRYRRVFIDIAAFETAINDSEEALDCGDTSIEFELANVATVIRHGAILGCYLLGRENFERYHAVRQFCEATGMPSEFKNGFPTLYRFRLALSRAHPMPTGATLQYAYDWCRRARMLVEELRRHGTH